MKKFLLIMIFVLFLPTISAYIIDGNNVYINDSKAYINANPATMSGSGWVDIKLQAKTFTGNIDFAIGLDSLNADMTQFQILLNTTDGNGSTYERWVDYSMNNISYSYDGKNDWHYATNVPITAGKIYNARFYMTIIPNTNGKYDIAVKPSAQSFAAAIAGGNFYLIDPWWNSTTNTDYAPNIYPNYWSIINNGLSTARIQPKFYYQDNLMLSQEFESLSTDELGHYIWTNSGTVLNTTYKKLGASSGDFVTNARLYTSGAPAINFATSNGTIEFWIYSRSNAPVWAFIDGNTAGSSTLGWVNNNNNNYIRLGSWAGPNIPDSLITNQWAHIVGTWNNGNVYFYFNGVLNASSTGSTGTSATAWQFGRDGVPQQFNGLIDGFKYYNRILNASEILAEYNNGSGRKYQQVNLQQQYPYNDNLISFWTMDGNSLDEKYYASLIPNKQSYNNTDCILGNCLNGLNSNLSTLTSLPGVTTKFTFAGWFKFSKMGTATYESPFGKTSGVANADTWCYMDTYGNGNYKQIRYQCASGTSSYGSNAAGLTLANNTWYHMALQYNGSELRLYQNGVLQSTTTGVASSLNTAAAYPLTICSYTNGGTPTTTCDEIGLWNSSDINVTYLYNNGVGRRYNESANMFYSTSNSLSKTCYQESANTSNQTGLDTSDCGLNYTGVYLRSGSNPYIYINYSKPVNALNTSLWRTKTGSAGVDTNVSIPYTCWNNNAQFLQLRLYTESGCTGAASYTDSQCWNGTAWQSLKFIDSGSSSSICGSAGDAGKYNDGDWNTYSFSSTGYAWYNTRGGSGGAPLLYEEAMYWIIDTSSLFANTTAFIMNLTSNDNNTYVKLSSSTYTPVTGGIINYSNGYVIHTFTNNGTLNTSGINLSNVEILVVAGGGAGGTDIAGGGGAGGLIYNTSYFINPGVYNITVGQGGVGFTGVRNDARNRGPNGGNSSFGNLLVAVGGGGGSYYNGGAGSNGGSGGGGGTTPGDVCGAATQPGGNGTTGQGNIGGLGICYAGGGGGGAGAPGGNISGSGVTATGGSGGVGLTISISGISVNYSCGGGGGSYTTASGTAGQKGCNNAGQGGGNSLQATSAVNGTGSGGGGGVQSTAGEGPAGSGGSGIVIIRYPLYSIVNYTRYFSQVDNNKKMTYKVPGNLFSFIINLSGNATYSPYATAFGVINATPTYINIKVKDNSSNVINNSFTFLYKQGTTTPESMFYTNSTGDYIYTVPEEGTQYYGCSYLPLNSSLNAGCSFNLMGETGIYCHDAVTCIPNVGSTIIWGSTDNINLNLTINTLGPVSNLTFHGGGYGGIVTLGICADINKDWICDEGNGVFATCNVTNPNTYPAYYACRPNYTVTTKGTHLVYMLDTSGANQITTPNYDTAKTRYKTGSTVQPYSTLYSDIYLLVDVGVISTTSSMNMTLTPNIASDLGNNVNLTLFLEGGEVSTITIIVNNVSISPSIANPSTQLLGYCNATTSSGNITNFNYTWFKNGASYTTGNLSGNFSSNVSYNIANLSTGYIVGDNISLGCIANNGIYSSSLNISSNLTILNYFNITFISQIPSDINSSNVINARLNITYNITGNNDTIANTYLYHKINSSNRTQFVFTNGTAETSAFDSAGPSITNISNSWNYLLSELHVYPATYNYNESAMRTTTHSINNMFNNGDSIKIQLLNITNTTRYNWVEIMINGTQSTPDIYYCNSSYSTGAVQSNANCYAFATAIPNTPYAHTHSVNSAHNVYPIVITNGNIGTVKVTSTSYIVVRTHNPPSPIWYAYYIPNVTRTGAAMTSSNSGSVWNELTGTFDAHMHQFDGTEYFNYFLSSCDASNNCTNSTIRQDLLDLGGLPPTIPKISSPTTGTYYGNMNISYSASESPNGYSILYYNISLMNSTGGFNKTIIANNSINLSYVWNTLGTLNGNYTIKVEVKDSLNQTSYDLSDLFEINYANTTINSVNMSPLIAYKNTTLLGYCNATTTGNITTFNYTWFKNGIVNLTNSTSGNYLSGISYNIANISNLSKNDNIIFSCNVYDGLTYSGWSNSSNVIILNTPPVIISSRFNPNSSLFKNTTIQALCNASDLDNDTLYYDYYLYKNNSLVNSLIYRPSCYQEQTNIATSCGGLGTGNSGIYSTWSGFNVSQPASNAYDGDWNTYAQSNDSYNYISAIELNYTIPSNILNTSYLIIKYQNKTGSDVIKNITTINSCLNNDTLRWRVTISNDGMSPRGNRDIYINCWNNTAYKLVTSFSIFNYTDYGEPKLYEEAMTWIFNNSASRLVNQSIEQNLFNLTNVTKGTNLTLQCQAYDGTNYSSSLNSSQATILNSPPVMFNTTFQITDDLSAIKLYCGANDVDSDPTFFKYNIYNNGVLIYSNESSINSTVLSYTTSDGEIISDTYVVSDSPTTSYGSSSVMWAYDKYFIATERYANTMINFNTTIFSLAADVTDAQYCTYIINSYTGAGDSFNITLFDINNTYTVSDSATWNTKPASTDFMNRIESKTISQASPASTTFMCFNVTNSLKASILRGDKNIQYYMNTSDRVSSVDSNEGLQLATKETVGETMTPRLIVSYKLNNYLPSGIVYNLYNITNNTNLLLSYTGQCRANDGTDYSSYMNTSSSNVSYLPTLRLDGLRTNRTYEYQTYVNITSEEYFGRNISWCTDIGYPGYGDNFLCYVNSTVQSYLLYLMETSTRVFADGSSSKEFVFPYYKWLSTAINIESNFNFSSFVISLSGDVSESVITKFDDWTTESTKTYNISSPTSSILLNITFDTDMTILSGRFTITSPDSIENISIDIYNDGIIEYTYVGNLTSSTNYIYTLNETLLNAYIQTGTEYKSVPIKFTANSSGNFTIKDVYFVKTSGTYPLDTKIDIGYDGAADAEYKGVLSGSTLFIEENTDGETSKTITCTNSTCATTMYFELNKAQTYSDCHMYLQGSGLNSTFTEDFSNSNFKESTTLQVDNYFKQVEMNGVSGTYTDGNYISKQLTTLLKPITELTITADDQIQGGAAITYYLSLDNGSTWLEASNGIAKTLTAGTQPKFKFVMNSNPGKTADAFVNSLTITDLGQYINRTIISINGTNYTYDYTFDSSLGLYKANFGCNAINSYLSTCSGLTCQVPITVTTSGPGILDLTQYYFGGSLDAINLNPNIVKKHQVNQQTPLTNVIISNNTPCYQESANISNQTSIDGGCNLNYNGTYSYMNWVSGANMIDGNWGTNAWPIYQSNNSEGTAYLYINYTKPNITINNAIWQIKWDYKLPGNIINTTNLTIPYNCLQSNNVQLLITGYTNITNTMYSYYCYNNNTYSLLLNGPYTDDTGSQNFYEEALIWNLPRTYINGSDINMTLNYPKNSVSTDVFINLIGSYWR